jgi:hypothetical protein
MNDDDKKLLIGVDKESIRRRGSSGAVVAKMTTEAHVAARVFLAPLASRSTIASHFEMF